MSRARTILPAGIVKSWKDNRPTAKRDEVITRRTPYERSNFQTIRAPAATIRNEKPIQRFTTTTAETWRKLPLPKNIRMTATANAARKVFFIRMRAAGGGGE